jgi:hypothetical protein
MEARRKRLERGHKTFHSLGPTIANPRKATAGLVFVVRVTTQRPVFIPAMRQKRQRKKKIHP